MLPMTDRAAIHLRDVLPDARLVRAADIQFSSCDTDPRRCRPGSLFVAITSDDHDGHEDALEALRRGASAVLAERLLPLAAPQAIVRDTRVAYGRLTHALAGDPSSQLQTFAIAGGHGKTSVAVLLEAILCAAGGTVAWRNSLASFDGEEVYDLPSNSADVSDLADWLRRSAAHRCDQAIVEVSTSQLARHGLAGLRADVAIVHGELRAEVDASQAAAASRRLFSRLVKRLKPEAALVANVDDPQVFELLGKSSRPTLTAGQRNPADVSATILERSVSEQTFLLQAGPESVPVRTPLTGDHQISNCLSAAAAAILAGVDLPTIARGIERVKWIPGQLERIECGQEFGVFVDAGSTPRAVELALRSVRRVTRGRVIVVCGGKSTLPSEERARLGHVLERYSHLQVLTNDDPEAEAPLELIHDLLDGFFKPEKPLVRPDREAAIGWALAQARPGDSVLLCGKALDGVQRLEDGDHPWDDGEHARQWLYRRQAPPTARPQLRVISEFSED